MLADYLTKNTNLPKLMQIGKLKILMESLVIGLLLLTQVPSKKINSLSDNRLELITQENQKPMPPL